MQNHGHGSLWSSSNIVTVRKCTVLHHDGHVASNTKTQVMTFLNYFFIYIYLFIHLSLVDILFIHCCCTLVFLYSTEMNIKTKKKKTK